jgi:hypothetical protein
MKRCVTLRAIASAAIASLPLSADLHAQTTKNNVPGLQLLPGVTAKPQVKRRGSGASRGSENEGVKARRRANAKPTSPDTSYNTITNTPRSATRTNSVQGAEPNANLPARNVPDRSLPESMRIQQETVRALPPRNELISKGGTSATPGVVNSPVEQNRIDSAAPSRQRLQIDDLSAQRPQQPNSSIGTVPSTNPTARGSANGSSMGTSGSTGSGLGSVTRSSAPTARAPASRGAVSGSRSSAGSSSGGGR